MSAPRAAPRRSGRPGSVEIGRGLTASSARWRGSSTSTSNSAATVRAGQVERGEHLRVQLAGVADERAVGEDDARAPAGVPRGVVGVVGSDLDRRPRPPSPRRAPTPRRPPSRRPVRDPTSRPLRLAGHDGGDVAGLRRGRRRTSPLEGLGVGTAVDAGDRERYADASAARRRAPSPSSKSATSLRPRDDVAAQRLDEASRAPRCAAAARSSDSGLATRTACRRSSSAVQHRGASASSSATNG